MMVIPTDLPSSLAPLAWMLGTWDGWGMLATDGEDPDTALIQRIRCDIVASQMRMTTTLWHAIPSGHTPIEPTWEAAEGLRHMTRGDLFREETMYVTVLPGSGTLPPPGQYEPREFTTTASDTRGFGALWAGVGVGPRVQMTSDAIARSPQAEDVTHLGRMYGLVVGELMWTQEKTVGQGDAAVELSGRLMRTEQATTASGQSIDGIDAEGEQDGFLV
ncbi:heme-binding beta-barrel domain-containing protein [Schaalia sp. ZJ1691]|uniref:FABP family protein n=1 Tax=Schaalia sp. ZJ1691 TaxID=2709404 RepID=UPI0013EC492F|nr:heme-binding beta-barrel domain-containing protein [Schaalia sp. ZJ1691]